MRLTLGGTGNSQHLVPTDQKQTLLKYLFIQMECCEQQTLETFIESDRLKKDDNLFYKLLTQIVEAFTYIHDRGLVHRDIKPANIFLDFKQDIKLGDFGLATTNGLLSEKNMSEAEDADEAGAGTPLYMSPEQQRGDKCSCAADMYSLGIVIFEMVYGRFNSLHERMQKIKDMRESIKFPPDFDKRAGTLATVSKDLIRKLLHHDPMQRPTSKEVYLELQDKLYEEMMDGNEYTKIIKFLFSAKNVFTGSTPFQILKNTASNQGFNL